MNIKIKNREAGIRPPHRSYKISRAVSRVLSWMIIYLGLPSPTASSDPPENGPGRPMVLVLVLLRMGFTWLFVLPQRR